MSDRIRIEGLRARAIVGVHDRERREPQDLVLRLELECDLRRAGGSDDLRDAVDYEGVASRIVDHVAASRFRLIEALAESVAAVVLEREPAVRAVAVRVEKPAALVSADRVSVEIRRARDE